MNSIQLIGNLCNDPEMRYSQSGTAIAVFNIAVKRQFKKDEVDFINCTAFGKTAEVIGDYLEKGSKIGINGNLRIEQYEDNEGNKRKAAKVIVNNIEFLNKIENKKNEDNYKPEKKQQSNNNADDENDGFPF